MPVPVPVPVRVPLWWQVREWKVGECLIFDDSFEHEVWHDGSTDRVVLICDLWHPDVYALLHPSNEGEGGGTRCIPCLSPF